MHATLLACMYPSLAFAVPAEEGLGYLLPLSCGCGIELESDITTSVHWLHLANFYLVGELAGTLF